MSKWGKRYKHGKAYKESKERYNCMGLQDSLVFAIMFAVHWVTIMGSR